MISLISLCLMERKLTYAHEKAYLLGILLLQAQCDRNFGEGLAVSKSIAKALLCRLTTSLPNRMNEQYDNDERARE